MFLRWFLITFNTQIQSENDWNDTNDAVDKRRETYLLTAFKFKLYKVHSMTAWQMFKLSTWFSDSQ